MSPIDTDNFPDDCTMQDVTNWTDEQLGRYINLSLDQGDDTNVVIVMNDDDKRMAFNCPKAP